MGVAYVQDLVWSLLNNTNTHHRRCTTCPLNRWELNWCAFNYPNSDAYKNFHTNTYACVRAHTHKHTEAHTHNTHKPLNANINKIVRELFSKRYSKYDYVNLKSIFDFLSRKMTIIVLHCISYLPLSFCVHISVNSNT